jgi:hypothetical protein
MTSFSRFNEGTAFRELVRREGPQKGQNRSKLTGKQQQRQAHGRLQQRFRGLSGDNACIAGGRFAASPFPSGFQA